VREWANRREAYAAALAQHVQLVVVALAVALLIGVPLGVLTTVRRRLARRTFAILSLVQTIPSIALFGLLIGPLTALSEAFPWLREIAVRGIGFTPALIALVLYSLLPIARNTEVGFLGVPPAVVDAARGMGMTGFQIMTRSHPGAAGALAGLASSPCSHRPDCGRRAGRRGRLSFGPARRRLTPSSRR
jgi:osmoprotectant transport system permease protein